MGGASLYFYLYFVCGGALLVLVGIATALWWFGRRKTPRGITTSAHDSNPGRPETGR